MHLEYDQKQYKKVNRFLGQHLAENFNKHNSLKLKQYKNWN